MQIGLVGAGRVGSVLATALHSAGYPLTGIASRSTLHAATLAHTLQIPVLDAPTLLAQADLVVLTVADDAIAAVAHSLAHVPATRAHQACVHCSGALALEPLAPLAAAGWHTGAWHPLQSFATRTTPLTTGITWGITAAEPLRSTLHELSLSLGGVPRDVAEAAKTRYHAAAVLACNYAITLAAQAVELLGSCGFDHDTALAALLPLLKGNLQLLDRAGLPTALTGPLARGDKGTVARHLAELEAHAPQIAALYRACGVATLPLLHERNLAQDDITALENLLLS